MRCGGCGAIPVASAEYEKQGEPDNGLPRFSMSCGLNSTPESDLTLQSERGRIILSNCPSLFYRVKLLIWAVWTATLTRIVWFWSRACYAP